MQKLMNVMLNNQICRTLSHDITLFLFIRL
jgi:hypothetical protein